MNPHVPHPPAVPTRVLLVELGGPHRDRLAMLLAHVPGLHVVAASDTAPPTPPDLVLLGLAPGDNAAQALLGLMRRDARVQGQPMPGPEAWPSERLSPREAQILGLLSQGHTAPEVAQRLQLSLHTVNTHLRNTYGKLGARNRLQAVQRARASGQID